MDIFDLIEEKKIKRWLGVRKRIIVEGGIYHITQRAPGRELIFLENSDYLRFLRLMKETSRKFKIDFICFCLMPNHLHFLLKINELNLSLAMKNIFEKYANYFNKKYRRKGHVFCGRYREAYCNDERYFLAISIYIHLNPLKAGLCKRCGDYRWSSIVPYIKEHKETFLKYKEILSILDEDMGRAREEYNKLLQEAKTIKYGSYLNNPNDLRNFILNFTGKILKKIKKSLIIKGETAKFINKMPSVLPREENGRKYLIQQLKANGFNKQEIAKVLGISRWTVYRILQHI